MTPQDFINLAQDLSSDQNEIHLSRDVQFTESSPGEWIEAIKTSGISQEGFFYDSDICLLMDHNNDDE